MSATFYIRAMRGYSLTSELEPNKANLQPQESKLSLYLNFLKLFADSGPLTAKEAHQLNSNGWTLKELCSHIDFLENQNLLSRTGQSPRKTIYKITQSGIRVLSYFKLLPLMPPIDDIENRTYKARPL
jgi:hypothetical protein